MKREKRESIFSHVAQKRYVRRFHAPQRNLLQVHNRAVHKNSTSVFIYKVCSSSFRIFSAASFKSLFTASSTASFVILITSRAPFRAGSASGSYGSGEGESSAISLSRSAASSAFLTSYKAVRDSSSFCLIASSAIFRPPFTHTSE